MKKCIYMLAPHEPNLDPRIDWEASRSAEVYETLVFGLHERSGDRPDFEQFHGYSVRRDAGAQLKDLPVVLHGFAAAVAPAVWLRIFVWILLGYVAALAVAMFCVRQVYRGCRSLIRDTFLNRYFLDPARRLDIAARTAIRRHQGSSLWLLLALTLHLVENTSVLWRQLRSTDPAPDLVHCNDVFALLPGFLAKKKYCCPLIYDSHEFWPYADVNASRTVVACIKWYEAKLIRWADAVITVSPQLAEQLELTYHLARVHVVPNVEPWRDRWVAEKVATADGTVTFLFQGNFAPDRGLAELIHAWRALPNPQAVLLLRGPDSPEKQKVQKLAAELQLLDTRVFFPPPVSEDALVQTAAEADVGIIPYKPVHEAYRYACPNKLSQYMHAGLAIITNDLPYVKEVVADAACGVWYDSLEETSMVRAFRRMLEDAEFRQRCCKNARDYARQKFNWQNYGERLMNIYAIEISRNSRTGNL